MACERLVRQGEAAIDSTRNCRAIKHSSDDPMAVPVKTNIFSFAEPVGPQPSTGEGVKVFSVRQLPQKGSLTLNLKPQTN